MRAVRVAGEAPGPEEGDEHRGCSEERIGGAEAERAQGDGAQDDGSHHHAVEQGEAEDAAVGVTLRVGGAVVAGRFCGIGAALRRDSGGSVGKRVDSTGSRGAVVVGLQPGGIGPMTASRFVGALALAFGLAALAQAAEAVSRGHQHHEDEQDM